MVSWYRVSIPSASHTGTGFRGSKGAIYTVGEMTELPDFQLTIVYCFYSDNGDFCPINCFGETLVHFGSQVLDPDGIVNSVAVIVQVPRKVLLRALYTFWCAFAGTLCCA